MNRIVLILTLAATMSLAAKEQSPLEYIIETLKVESESGLVTESAGTLAWPRILEREPTAIGPWHGNHARVELELPTSAVVTFLSSNGFKRDQAIKILSDIPLIKKLSERTEPMYSACFELPRLGNVEVIAFVDNKVAGRAKVTLMITQLTMWFVRPDTTTAEQAGANQPAIRSESRPDGNRKPQPGSEGRSR